jgi:hypothetical protein
MCSGKETRIRVMPLAPGGRTPRPAFFVPLVVIQALSASILLHERAFCINTTGISKILNTSVERYKNKTINRFFKKMCFLLVGLSVVGQTKKEQSVICRVPMERLP